jgi:hypothetical protein
MYSSMTALRPRRGAELLAPERARERSIRRRVGITWGLLILNGLTYYGSLAHIPTAAGRGVQQGALQVALLMALTVNRRVIVRPNVFLCLASLLVFGAVVSSLPAIHLGSFYRVFRLAEFVAVLWLLTPWWGRRDLLLVRCHLASLYVVLGTVVLGLLVAPGRAIPAGNVGTNPAGTDPTAGRLTGVLWFIAPTQVAHYAAVALGMVVILWLCGQTGGRSAMIATIAAAAILILTHTRTALVGLVVGILVAGLSLITAEARVRKFFAAAAAVLAIAIIAFSSAITTWLTRGEAAGQLLSFTGRTKFWGPLLAFPRDKFQEIFGFGLSNSSFNGLSIDNNWLSSYQQQGVFGAVVCAAFLFFLLVAAYFQPSGARRALALFLIMFCLVSSFTEDGFTDASIYLLDLTLAASLLVPSAADRGRTLNDYSKLLPLSGQVEMLLENGY